MKHLMTLEMELGMSESEANSSEGWRGTGEGEQMKSSSSDTPSWNGTNSRGFSALPGGGAAATLQSSPLKAPSATGGALRPI